MSTNGSKPPPILDLDTLIEPGATWVHKGKTYEYVRWSALGLLERKRINNRHQRVQALEELDNPSDEEAAEYEQAVKDLVGLITVDLPSEVIDGMEPEKRTTVVTYFLALRLLRTSDLQEKRIAAATEWAKSFFSMPATSSPASTDSGRKPTRSSGSKSPTSS